MSKNTIKKLTQHKIQKAGRNNYGRITVCHRGGGNKKLYRLIDYKRSLFNIPAIVKNIDYDPNRSSYIALISYQNGMLSYILAPKNLNIGDTIIATRRQNNVEISIGNTSAISNLPTGTIIHNIELKPGQGGKLMRSAGTHAKIITKSLAEKNAIIRLHSGKLYSIPLESMATIGIVSNDLHKNKKLKKAGESRWKNKRPVVRGVAMNPIDHPHGGGEGRSKGGRHPVTPWGKLTKGKPTSYIRKSTRRKKKA